jgi:hypothetical protein
MAPGSWNGACGQSAPSSVQYQPAGSAGARKSRDASVLPAGRYRRVKRLAAGAPSSTGLSRRAGRLSFPVWTSRPPAACLMAWTRPSRTSRECTIIILAARTTLVKWFRDGRTVAAQRPYKQVTTVIRILSRSLCGNSIVPVWALCPIFLAGVPDSGLTPLAGTACLAWGFPVLCLAFGRAGLSCRVSFPVLCGAAGGGGSGGRLFGRCPGWCGAGHGRGALRSPARPGRSAGRPGGSGLAPRSCPARDPRPAGG